MIRPPYEYAIRSHHRVGTDLREVSPLRSPSIHAGLGQVVSCLVGLLRTIQ